MRDKRHYDWEYTKEELVVINKARNAKVLLPTFWLHRNPLNNDENNQLDNNSDKGYNKS